MTDTSIAQSSTALRRNFNLEVDVVVPSLSAATVWNSLSSQTDHGVGRGTSRNLNTIIIIIIIIINDNVYGAILMTMVTARVHPVHLMNAD